jgi:hypothetical protein
MTAIVQGLFGVSPEQLQMQQDQALQARAQQYAQMSPQEQSTSAIYTGVSKLGGAVGGMLGGVDPMQQQASKVASILQGSDQTTAQGMMDLYRKFTEAGLPEQAQMAAMKVKELQKSEADINQVQAKTAQEAAAAQAAQYKIDQEKLMTAELAALPADHTDADILKTVTKYGSAKDILQTVQQASDKKAAREQALTLAQQAADAKVEAARLAGASRLEIAQLVASNKNDIAQLMGGLRQQGLADKKEEKAAKEAAQKAGVVASFDGALETIDRLATHPGKEAAVGFGGKTTSWIPGTNAAGFASQLETFKAQVFLPQVQALKGMGALSDAEGKKMSAAVGALDQSMKPSEFNSQLSIIKNDLKKARARVSGGELPAAPSPTIPPASSDGWSIKPKGQ